MSDTASSLFVAGAFTGAAWDLVRQQMAPRQGDASPEEIGEELAIRDAIAQYYYAFDQGDLEASLAVFTDDCVVMNIGWTARGRDALRQAYEDTVRAVAHRFHYISNQIVRLSPDLVEALVTSYFYAILDGGSGAPKAVGGVVGDQMVKTEVGWKITSRTTTEAFSVALSTPT